MLSLAPYFCALAMHFAAEQPEVAGPPAAIEQDPAVVPEAPPDGDAWELSLSAYWSAPPDEDAYGSATLYADRGPLHLEARWNYEALDTASLWVGWHLPFGDELAVEFTPMLGGVFGDTSGIAPGFELDLSWKQLEFYTEDEYVFDLEDDSDSFFYSWTTLTWTPVEWLHTGLVGQRTRITDTGLDINRGLLLGVAYENFDLTVYAFNLDAEAYFQVALGIGF